MRVPHGFVKVPSAALIDGIFSFSGTIDIVLPRDEMTSLACFKETEEKGYTVDTGIVISFSAETIDDSAKDGGSHFTQCLIGICPLPTHSYQNLRLLHKITRYTLSNQG